MSLKISLNQQYSNIFASKIMKFLKSNVIIFGQSPRYHGRCGGFHDILFIYNNIHNNQKLI